MSCCINNCSILPKARESLNYSARRALQDWPAEPPRFTDGDTEVQATPEHSCLQKYDRGFPGGPVVKTPHFTSGTLVRSLVGELRSHMLCSTAQKKKYIRAFISE